MVSVSDMRQHNDSKVVCVSTMWQHNDSKVVSVRITSVFTFFLSVGMTIYLLILFDYLPLQTIQKYTIPGENLTCKTVIFKSESLSGLGCCPFYLGDDFLLFCLF